MAFDLEQLENELGQISLDLIMLSPDNLVEVSELLGKIEPLNEMFAPLESELPGRIVTALNESLKAVIRGQVADLDQAMALVGDGLSMLQELARSLPVKAPFKGDIDGWAASLAALCSEDGIDQRPEDLAEEAVEAVLTDIALYAEPPCPADAAKDRLSGTEPREALSAELFKTEFTAEIEEIQVTLVAIEQKEDPLSALSELLRNFRILMGAAELLRLESMGRIIYNAGGLIEYVTAEQVPYSTAVTDILLKACDYLLDGFRGLEIIDEGRGWRIAPDVLNADELNDFSDKLWMARQGILDAPASADRPAASGAAHAPKPKKIGEILVEKGLISEGDLGGLIEAQQKARKATLGEILVAEQVISEEELEEALEQQKSRPNKKLGEILVESGRLDQEEIEKAIKSQDEKRETRLGEFLVKSKIGAPDKVALALREQKQSEGRGQVMAQTVKVETRKLDGLIDLVGELVIAQSLVSSSDVVSILKEQKILKDMAQVSRITSELQRNAMSLRMVQIGQTFQKMQRLVRDLAHKVEKDVKFETIGSDTEVDRNMVESIYDPLVHLVRNALDHGLEMPQERKDAGKSPQGLVRLKAYHQGGNVVIELTDDGRGLDRAKVLKKAVEQGLVSPGENLSDAAVHALVFHPGFSTAEKISDVSGRGVGMDVVKQSIEKLRGKVDFASVPGQGSTMTIRLPLTLAIIDGMIVRVGEHRYILPTISIVESFRPELKEYYTVKGQGEMIRVRGHLVPLMRLDRIVGAHGAVANPEDALVVVVENEGEQRCLLVDEVLGKQEVVIKSLGEGLKYVRALAGGTILGDGRVGLILDVAGLFELAGLSGGSAGFGGPGVKAASAEDGNWGMEDDFWN